jgi:pimeloyl-ACP methyl ester carboxylesterase
MPDRVTAAAAVSSLPFPGDGDSGHTPFRYRTPLIAFGAPVLGPAIAGAVLRVLGLPRSTPAKTMIEDYEVCCRPWGFEPAEIPGPVNLWHARRDRLVPVSHALQLASALPTCRPALEPRGGHFFFRSRTREILGSVVEELHQPHSFASLPPGGLAPVDLVALCATFARDSVGAPGFEPGTSATQRPRATRLRHAPSRRV